MTNNRGIVIGEKLIKYFLELLHYICQIPSVFDSDVDVLVVIFGSDVVVSVFNVVVVRVVVDEYSMIKRN